MDLKIGDLIKFLEHEGVVLGLIVDGPKLVYGDRCYLVMWTDQKGIADWMDEDSLEVLNENR